MENMREFKGTKGKWDVMARSEIRFSIIGDQIDVWAFNEVGDIPYEEAKANAQLISKAPEMLDLLNHFVNADPNDGSWDYQACISKARQLIKEATTI